MKVYLIRSEEFSTDQFRDIVEFLGSFEGQVQFLPNEALLEYEDDEIAIEEINPDEFVKQDLDFSMEEYCEAISNIPERRPVATWNSLFDKCKWYRQVAAIPDSEMVLLLTNVANERNWFYMLDPQNPMNGFIHTDEWEYYVRCSATYPIAYIVASMVLQRFMFNNLKDFISKFHPSPWDV